MPSAQERVVSLLENSDELKSKDIKELKCFSLLSQTVSLNIGGPVASLLAPLSLCKFVLFMFLQVLVVLFVTGAGQRWHVTANRSSRCGNGQLTALWTLFLPTLLPGRLRFSNVNIRVNIEPALRSSGRASTLRPRILNEDTA